jgi:chemotaxis protein histidine kinase CheA
MIVFGRGLVHPVDFHHTHNPPSHPRLLELLADELAAGGYQLRPFVRELLLSRTYARTCDAPRAETINLADIAARQALIDKQRQAAEAAVPALDKAVADARSALRKAREADSKLTAELPKLEAAVKAAEQKLTQATSERAKAEATAAKAQQQAQAVAEAAAKLEVAAEVVAEDESIRVAAAAISAKASQLGSAASAAAVVAAEKAAEQKAAEKLLADARSKVSEAASNRLTPERFEALAQAELTASAALAEGRYAVAQVRGELAIAKAISEHAAMTDPAKADAAWQALVDQWTINLQVAPLKPLTPEQMAASVMQAAGVLGPEAAAIAAKLEKSPPEALKKASDGERERLMASLVDKGLLERLRGAASEFVRQYGGQSGQDFQATVNQALFFGNGGVVDGWLKPAGENLVARLNAMTDSDQLAEELYLAVFSRFPSEAERRETAAYLKDRSDRPVAIAELAWALLSSSEFRFNH